MQLSENFTLREMTRSQTASRFGLDNTPDAEAMENLRYLAKVMETVRKTLGNRRIFVSSGYRAPSVNRAVGGSGGSSHCKGLAVDFTVEGMSNATACEKIRDNITGFDQLIYEYGEDGWIHLGLAPEGRPARQQVLSAGKIKTKTVYLPGIVAA